MKTFIQKHKILVVVVAVIGAFWMFPSATAVMGHLEARIDVARGRYLVWGKSRGVPWRLDYARLLQERYGIECRRPGGCVMFESHRSYLRAYDEIASAAAIRQFGSEAFTECEAEARKAWEERNAAAANAK